MTFKKIKEGKEICHGEVISKEDFLEVKNIMKIILFFQTKKTSFSKW